MLIFLIQGPLHNYQCAFFEIIMFQDVLLLQIQDTLNMIITMTVVVGQWIFLALRNPQDMHDESMEPDLKTFHFVAWE